MAGCDDGNEGSLNLILKGSQINLSQSLYPIVDDQLRVMLPEILICCALLCS